jgi:predicted ATPase/DNA-binding winged helix-turn-helix (wHTH) protein
MADTMPKAMATPPAAQHALAFGPFKLLRSERLLLQDGLPVRLGGRALDLLVALVERAGEVVSRQELEACVWPRTIVEETSLRAHISALRKALGDGQGGARYIVNQPGRGYCFVAPVARLTEPTRAVPAVALHGLPARLAHMVGRNDVVAKLCAQLESCRFITIVGPGGIGKTTVAVAVAESSALRYANGVCFIDLASVAHEQGVPAALASGFGLAAATDDVVTSLANLLRHARVLAVIDNCEHVVTGLVPLVEQLLKTAPGLHVLATGREPLRADGEWLYRLPPLGLPEQADDITASQAMAYPAVQLFVDRAVTSTGSFELCDSDAADVTQLCRRLDGNPLAIELAAARVHLFGVRGLARQLDAHLLHLKGRTSVARHETLGLLLDWSYDLLSEPERSVLRQLSVFSARFSLDAALELVTSCGDAAPLATQNRVFDTIMDLADKSLIVSDISSDTVCFRLLELTRAYARDKLEHSGAYASVAAKHAQLVLELVRRAAQAWPDAPTKRQWFEAYGWAADDIRAALAWAFSEQGDPSLGAWLAGTVWPLAINMNPFDEPGAIERALQAVMGLPDAPVELEMRLHIASAAFRQRQRDPGAEGALNRALQLAERSGEAGLEAEVLMGMTVASLARGAYEQAAAHAERLQAAARRSSDPLTLLVADRFGAQASHFAGDHDRARVLAERVLSHPIARGRLGPAGMIDHRVSMRIVLSRVLWLEGFADEAMALAEQAVEFAETDGPPAVCQALSLSACPIALWRGDMPAAQELVARLEAEYSRHAVRGGWSPAAAGIPWRRVLQAQQRAEHPPRTEITADEAANVLQTDHLITAHATFVTRDAVARATNGHAGWCAAEILRARGQMLLHGGATSMPESERLFQRSRSLARQQGALAWELRAVISLAGLWNALGRKSDAQVALEQIHERFAEGHATADLRRAAALLDTLHSA